METRFCSDGAERRREAHRTSAVIRITKNPARILPIGLVSLSAGFPSCSFVSFVAIAWFLELLLQRINSKAAEQLGIEISGLLRQHLPGECDVAQLLHTNWTHQKRNISFTTLHLDDGFAGIA